MNHTNRNNWVYYAIDLIVKLTLPVAIAYFGWVQYKTSLDFETTKSDKELMLKFIEIAWTSLNSDDTTKIRNSVRLLGTIDPKYSYQLLTVLSEDSLKYGFLKDEIAPILSSAQFEVVENLSIKIDYTSNKFESEAHEIKSRLMSETRLEYGDVSLVSKRRLETMPCNNVIHYSTKTDFSKIKALQNYLNQNLNSKLYFSLKLNENMKQNEVIVILC